MASYAFSVLEEGPYRPRDVPTAEQIQRMAQLGLALGAEERKNAINRIGAHLHVPAGGWSYQTRLFEHGDIRLKGVLALLTHETAARHAAANLASAARHIDGNLLMTMVIAQREAKNSLTATGDAPVDSFWEGGLDHLAKNKNHLGLPRSVTDKWVDIPRYRNPDREPPPPGQPDRRPWVYPAFIAAHDQMLIYAAQLNASYEQNFKGHVRAALGAGADAAIARMTRIGRLVWRALAFLRPGGNPYDPRKTIHEQSHGTFGSNTAVQYIAHLARAHGKDALVDLDYIYKDSALNAVFPIRSAKTRTVETLFLERLLTTVRELVF